MEQKIPKVFISYSHDSKEIQDKVLEFSNKLRKEGIDANIDQYIDSPPEGWPKWMERNIEESDYVLVLSTMGYKMKASGQIDGNGINWETNIVYQHLYNAGTTNDKFIPILTNQDSFKDILTPLQSATFYNIDNEEDYESLYWRLRGVKKERPELGKLRELPEKSRKTLFVSGLIEQDLWFKAKWKNVPVFFFADTQPSPPILPIVFDDFEIGKIIFKNIIDKVGTKDEEDRLRISIVEGEVPNQEYGYFITIGENIKATNQLLQSYGAENIELIVVQQQIHRMNVPEDSENLKKFKDEFNKYKCYYVVPARRFYDDEKGWGFEIDMNSSILKKEIYLRNYDDISDENDPDKILRNKEIIDNKF